MYILDLDELAANEVVKKNNRQLNSYIGKLEEERLFLLKELNLKNKIENTKKESPSWASFKSSSFKNKAIACSILSDTHFDEVVKLEETNGVNEYNRKIATKRLKEYFKQLVLFPHETLNFNYDGLMLCLGGDIVSGNIHEELAQTNESFIMDTCIYWSNQISKGIELLSEEYKKIHIVCCPGNHGRTSKLYRYKGRAQDNFDWLIYSIIARDFKHNKNITFQIPEVFETVFNVYNTKYLLTHGDSINTSSSGSGLYVPVQNGLNKKFKLHNSFGNPFDFSVLGHFHQYMTTKRFLINGALKGMDEYAFIHSYEFENPSQAFWVTLPQTLLPICHCPFVLL